MDATLPSRVTVVHAGPRGDRPELPALQPRLALHALHPEPRACEAFAGATLAAPPVAVALAASSGTAWLHVTERPEFSSLLELDPPACDELFGHMRDYPAWLSARRTVERREVPATTLDEWTAGAGLSHVDLLSLSTQGSELDALRGAARLLAGGRIGVVRTAVALRACYRGQPTCAEFDAFLTRLDYALVDLGFPWERRGRLRPDGAGAWGEAPRFDRGHATWVAGAFLRGEGADEPALAAALVVAQLGYGSTAAWMLDSRPSWPRERTPAWLDAWARPTRSERRRAWLRRFVPPPLAGW